MADDGDVSGGVVDLRDRVIAILDETLVRTRILVEAAFAREVGTVPIAGVERDTPAPVSTGVPSAPRARECMMFLAEQNRRGLSPSNREIATGIGIVHKSQVSKLLARLLEQNLVSKNHEGAGKRNSWRLTLQGEAVARTLMHQEYVNTSSTGLPTRP